MTDIGFPARAARLAPVAVACVVLIGFMCRSARINDSRAHVGDPVAGSAWLAAYTEPVDVFMSREPVTDFLHSNRPAIGYPPRLLSLSSTELLMMSTIPVVLYGVFRYLFLVHVRGLGGSPEELLLKDRSLAVAVALFLIVSGAILYFSPRPV